VDSPIVDELKSPQTYIPQPITTMLTKYTSKEFIRIGLGILFIHASYRMVKGFYDWITHDWTVPDYHLHTHDMCHTLTYLLAFLMAWYITVIVLILNNRAALEMTFALRILGFPTLISVLVLLVVICFMYIAYTEHDEFTYAMVLSIADGIFLVFLSVFHWSFLTAYIQGVNFVKSWLYIGLIFYAFYTLFHYYNDFVIDTLFVLVGLLSFAWGMNTIHSLKRYKLIK